MRPSPLPQSLGTILVLPSCPLAVRHHQHGTAERAAATEADALREAGCAAAAARGGGGAGASNAGGGPLARPVIASPVVGHSTAPLATSRTQAAVRAIRRGGTRRGRWSGPTRSSRRRTCWRGRLAPPGRREGDDVEAARPPAAAEARAAQKSCRRTATAGPWARRSSCCSSLRARQPPLGRGHAPRAGDDVELSFDLHGWTAAGHHTAAAPTPAPTSRRSSTRRLDAPVERRLQRAGA